MRLSVETLLQAQEASTPLAFNEYLDFPPDIGVMLAPMSGELSLTRTQDDQFLRVVGQMSTRLELTCDRCGEAFERSIQYLVDETLEVSSEPSPAQEVEDSVCATGELDLSDLLRQTLLLALPARLLCGCEPLPTNPEKPLDRRWEKLKQLSSPQPGGNIP